MTTDAEPSLETEPRETRPPAAPPPRSTRPPWWLVAFTLLIPVSVFVVWYANWIGRPLSAGTIVEYLGSSNDKDVYHALYQVSKQAQDAAEERDAAVLRISRSYEEALAAARNEKSGEEFHAAKAKLDDERRAALEAADGEFNRVYGEIEQTFDAVLDFTRQGRGRDPNLLEAACGALAAMNHSDTWREPARKELLELMEHESLVVRRAAACNLSAFGDGSGREIILEMLEDPDAKARQNGCLAIMKVGKNTDAQRVKILADKDADPTVREFAWRAYTELSAAAE